MLRKGSIVTRVFSYFMHEDEVLTTGCQSFENWHPFFAKFFIPPFFFLFSIIFISEFNIGIFLISFLFFANIRVTWNEKKKGKNGREGRNIYTCIETTARGEVEEREIDDKNNER